MVFDCQQCGECCSHLGLVHSITEDRGNYTFMVFNRYTNESNIVTIDPDKHALYDDTSIFEETPRSMPLLPAPAGFGEGLLYRPPHPARYLPGLWLLAGPHCQQERAKGGQDHVFAVPLLGRSPGNPDL